MRVLAALAAPRSLEDLLWNKTVLSLFSLMSKETYYSVKRDLLERK